MAKKFEPQKYHLTSEKRILDFCLSIIAYILFVPFILVISLLIKINSKGPTFFIQKRTGYKGKPFTIYMFRTMYVGAERDQEKYRHLNEADGPVFKIRDDPRFVGIGKLLARTGLDELPQLINVLKGEMSLVGPRPLPVYEAKKLTSAQKVRELVKPGMTSSWVISGAHNLSFKRWMELDAEYVKNASLLKDLEILFKTFLIVVRQIVKQLSKTNI